MSWTTLKFKAAVLMMEWDPDPEHARHVCHLAKHLFEELHSIHQLDAHPRHGLTPIKILELAGMLHDIGWTAPGNRGHHKKSRNRIMNADLPGLSDFDKNIVSQVARYHRKRHPDPMRHFQFAELNQEDQDLILWLSGMLRIADGLDRAHTTDVDHLICDISEESINICIYCSTGSATAIDGANRKKGLLEEISDRKVTIINEGSYPGH